MADEIVVKIKLIPDNTAIEKYLAKLGKTSIAMKGIGGAGKPSNGGEGQKDLDDSLKKNLKIFKADLFLKWTKRIWQITEKNIPLMNVFAKMNNSLIRLFLFPIMLRIFKVLLPIYVALFKLGAWWVGGGFEKVMSDLFGDEKTGKGPVQIGIGGIFAALGVEKLFKIFEVIGSVLSTNFDEMLGKAKTKILEFAEKWGLTEIYNIIKTSITDALKPLTDALKPLAKPFEEVIGKVTGLLGVGKGALTGALETAGGKLAFFADKLLWASFAVDVVGWIADVLLEWVNDPFWRTVLIYISNLADVVAPLVDVVGWVWSAFSDLFGIITTGKLEFNSLFARFREIGEAFKIFTGTTSSILSGMGLLGKASGGPVSGGQSYLVGEKGPEIFTPGVGGNITPNNKMGGGGTSIGNINVTINAAKIDSSNMNAIAKEISDRIYTDVRRRVTF